MFTSGPSLLSVCESTGDCCVTVTTRSRGKWEQEAVTHHSPHRPEPSKRLRAKVDEGILRVCAWMVDPQPCCSPQANSCWCQEAKLRAVEPFFISGKPYLPEPWCASHRAIENTYFLHAGWYFSPALKNILGPSLGFPWSPFIHRT